MSNLEWPIHLLSVHELKFPNFQINPHQNSNYFENVAIETCNTIEIETKRSADSHNSVYGINIWCNWCVCVSVFFSLCFVLFVVWPFACLFVCSVCVGSCMHACVMKWYAECKIVFENYLNVLYVIKLTNNDDNNCDWFGRNKCNVFWAVWLSFGRNDNFVFGHVMLFVVFYFRASSFTPKFKYKKVSTLTACHHNPCNRRVENIHEK